MQRAEVDEEIRQTERLIRSGALALMQFQEPTGLYLRDTSGGRRQRPPERGSAPVRAKPADRERAGATSTNRAVGALVEAYVTFAEIASRDDKPLVKHIRDQLARSAPLYLSRATQDKGVRNSKTNQINTFTDSHAIVASLMLCRMAATTDGETQSPLFGKRYRLSNKPLSQFVERTTKWQEDMDSDGGLKLNDATPSVHHFVTLAGVRAIDAVAMYQSGDSEIATIENLDGVEAQVTAMLAYDYAGVYARFDPAELAFSTAVLARGNRPLRKHLTTRSVRSIVEAQHDDGSWSPARSVLPDDPRALFIASYEVALALVGILERDLGEDGELFDLVASVMRKMTSLIDGNYQASPGQQGWSNDHVRAPRYVESWATAMVVSLLCRWRSALVTYRQNQVLLKYRVEYRTRSGPERAWPDLAERLSRPTPRPLSISDPTTEGRLAEDLEHFFVTPSQRDPSGRPEQASFLMFGPPGSRKTSLVRELSTALGWPLVTLSPPDFLVDGLDGFEARAAEVFSDLFVMQRVIVLFDECESFFLKRQGGSKDAEVRTQGAFITAGMLPRLQELRDRRWVIFALATNEGPEALDPAVTRKGRFDLHHEQAHPSADAQSRYLEAAIDKLTTAAGKTWAPKKAELARLRDATKRATAIQGDTNPITFGVLDDVSRWLASLGRLDEPAANALVERLNARANAGPPRLSPREPVTG